MTRLPHENWDVQPYPGKAYKVGPGCCVPDCARYADHAHHLWRRSFLGKAASWVQLWDDTILGNLVGLCYQHHQEVTEGAVQIVYEGAGNFLWGDHGYLTAQPPVGGELGTASTSTQKPKELTADREVCAACGHRRRTVSADAPVGSGERRPRASWSIQVPSDEREKGADVLDELCEGVMEAFGREYHTSGIARYFAVSEAFVFVIQHRHLLETS